ncbi:MAG: hypothetical protein H6718_36335 [Polyangiaceae bacterium]|nr:hypothetical protein [Polyangiaceae bacterium]
MAKTRWHGTLVLLALGTLHCSTNDSKNDSTGGTGGTNSSGSGGVGGTAGTQHSTGGTFSGGAAGGGSGGTSGGVGGAGSDAGGAGGSEDAGPGCDPGFFGPTCEACTCGPKGDCDDGIEGSGQCSCDSGWSGEKCDACAGGHYGPNCSICTCNVHGTCDEGLTGTGVCACDDGWGGTNCQTCAENRYGASCESTCPICTFGDCEAGQSGTGKCCITVPVNGHVNQDMAAQTGTFSVEWDGSASAQTDGIFGLTVDDTANDWSDFAVATRFSPLGLIDARNGGNYEHDAFVPYSGGQEFHFRMTVDLSTHTYSVWVTPSGGAETQIAANYNFRPTLNTVTELRNAAGRTQTNVQPIRICNFSVVSN